MTPEQVIDLLSLIAIRDRRTIGKTDVTVWAFDIGDLDFADASQAVADHFREQPDTWLMAGHIRRRVEQMRADRLGPPGPGLSPIPPPADPDDVRGYLAALRAQQARIADGAENLPALDAGEPADPEGNPHARRILAEFRARQADAQRRRAERAAAESEALRLYRDAVKRLTELDVPERVAAVMDRARDELLGDEQAAAGFPLLASLPGVMDEHRITIHAARLAAEEGPCAPPAD
jgi:hypothetical protein